MTTIPHDITDLALAPVALTIDARLEELGALDLAALRHRVDLYTQGLDDSRELRRHGMLTAILHDVELHGWSVAWHDRGLALTHGPHLVVLGVPTSVRHYLDLPSRAEHHV